VQLQGYEVDTDKCYEITEYHEYLEREDKGSGTLKQDSRDESDKDGYKYQYRVFEAVPDIRDLAVKNFEGIIKIKLKVKRVHKSIEYSRGSKNDDKFCQQGRDDKIEKVALYDLFVSIFKADRKKFEGFLIASSPDSWSYILILILLSHGTSPD
jgi:hypothetical protein